MQVASRLGFLARQPRAAMTRKRAIVDRQCRTIEELRLIKQARYPIFSCCESSSLKTFEVVCDRVDPTLYFGVARGGEFLTRLLQGYTPKRHLNTFM